MNSRYVLILVSLNPDQTDLSGIKYPNKGYIECKNYKQDRDIRYGLYGTLWGKTDNTKWLNTDEKAFWTVVQAEINDDLIAMDQAENFVKYRKGIVVCSGGMDSCVDYIAKKAPDKEPGLFRLKNQKPLVEEHVLVMGNSDYTTVTSASGFGFENEDNYSGTGMDMENMDSTVNASGDFVMANS